MISTAHDPTVQTLDHAPVATRTNRKPGRAGTPGQHFLAFPHFSSGAWEALGPGERELHTFWTKRFLPLYRDYSRVRDEDVSGPERTLILSMLRAIAGGQIL